MWHFCKHRRKAGMSLADMRRQSLPMGNGATTHIKCKGPGLGIEFVPEWGRSSGKPDLTSFIPQGFHPYPGWNRNEGAQNSWHRKNLSFLLHTASFLAKNDKKGSSRWLSGTGQTEMCTGHHASRGCLGCLGNRVFQKPPQRLLRQKWAWLISCNPAVCEHFLKNEFISSNGPPAFCFSSA